MLPSSDCYILDYGNFRDTTYLEAQDEINPNSIKVYEKNIKIPNFLMFDNGAEPLVVLYDEVKKEYFNKNPFIVCDLLKFEQNALSRYVNLYCYVKKYKWEYIRLSSNVSAYMVVSTLLRFNSCWCERASFIGGGDWIKYKKELINNESNFNIFDNCSYKNLMQ